MQISNGVLHLETSQTGARIHTFQKGSKHFFYPQQYIDKDGGIVMRGGMHICSPIFGSPDGKGAFSKAPQHGELRDLRWDGHATSRVNPSGICYARIYTEWDAKLLYSTSYFLDDNQLTTYVDIRNLGTNPNDVELGLHPYFNAPNGGTISFLNTETPVININDAFGPEVFPACETIVIELPGVGRVTLLLEDGFNAGYVCVWTDWRQKYFCVEPLLTYEKFGKSVTINPQELKLSKMTMIIND